MKMNYKTLRQIYYGFILSLIIYALPGIKIIEKYFYPIFEFELLPSLTVISFIAMVTGVMAFTAYKYRKLG